MTSTNDGKDVKSNQTSGQKGKTYYIELYKSLEARLSAECTGEQRTRLVCEAWRRVHSLCQHSAPTTHPHLLAWLQRHTSHTILQTEWQSPKSKDQHVWLEEAIDTFIGECQTAISTRDGVSPSWESQLLHRAQWFRKVLSNPWGHPVLKALLDSRGVQPTDEEVLGWLKEERGVMFVTRLRQLAASKCDDLALLLATAVMLRARNSTAVVSDVDQAADHKDQTETARSEPTFVDILRRDAGFTVDVWELLTDIEFVLLHKGESRSRCIELAKQTPLRNGYQLVERLHSRLEMSPRDKKMWKNAKEVATLIAQVVIARCMVVPTCSGAARVALYGCARSLVRLLPADKLPTAAAALAAPAATARHLHTLATAIHAQCKDERKSFVCELYVRAITAGMNELERLKLKTEKEAEARLTEETLSTWFTQLGSLLSASSRLSSECVLTAFSVHPSSFMYDRVKAAPLLAPILKDIHEPRTDTNSEFGSWATDSRTQTNLVKTSETINLKQTQKQANVLSTAIFAEGEALGLGAELCQDLAVLISGPRVKTLSWDMDRETLLENCRTYMERTHGGTRALTTELKYLNLDPRSFQHLPEEIDDENDAFYGIEKGYEHLVDLQEPEEIWQDALSDDPTLSDSAHSIEELPIVIPRRKKKSRRLKYTTDEEIDPLSLVGDTNTTAKERPHSKERSKEKKERLDKIKIKKESSKDFDQGTENVQKVGEKTKDIRKKEKKKERKERKKKEKAVILECDTKQQKPQSGSLSRLVGMKVARIPEVNGQLKSELDSNINNNLCITDSDYDSQGKSSITSINSEGNDPDVLFDGLFSMDEIKSPEKSTDCTQRSNTFKTEELRVSNGIVMNNTLAVPKIRHATNQQQRINFQALKSDSSSGQSSKNDVREEVKKSIKKLIEFRRHKSINDGNMKIEEPHHQTLMPDIPTSDNLTGSNSPKVYFNRENIQQFNALKDEVNIILKNCSNRGNIIQEPTFINDLNKKNDKINTNICDKTHDILMNRPSEQACSTSAKSYQQPVIKANSNPSDLQLEKTVRNNVLKNNETPSQIQYKEFLKQRSSSVIKTHPLVKNVTDISSQKPLTNIVKRQSSKPICKPRQKISNPNIPCIESIQRDFLTQTKTDVSETLNSKKDDGNISLESSINCQSMGNANLSPAQNQFQSFLKELQETINAGASKEKPDVKLLSDKTNCPKQKRVDNAPNTFSRLSYLHKNKQNDNKHKLLSDQTKTLKNKSSEEKQNLSMNLDKVSHLQTRGEIVVSRVDKTKSDPCESAKVVVQKVQNFKCSPLTKNTPLCLNRQYPIISNILMSENRSYDSNKSNEVENKSLGQKHIVTPVPSLRGNLTENDQNDLILLLRQQSKMHPLKLHHKSDDVPKNPSNCTVTIDVNKHSSIKPINKDIQPKDPPNVNRNVPILDKSFATSNSSSTIKVSNSKSSNTVSELKKIRTVKASGKGATSKQTVKSNDTQTSDWESVMNALLAQKTPSRGPNALDIVLKKDSFEKRSLQNAECHTVKAACPSSNSSRAVGEYANSKQCPIKTKSTLANSGKTVQLDMTPSPYLKQKQDKKLGGQDNNIVLGRNSPLDFKEKHLPDVIQNANDPFISGIPNSDYDLLEELMDDDLRKEIGELMSDEEAYSALTQSPKTRTVPNTKTSHSFVNKYPNQNVDTSTIRKTQKVDSCQNLDLVNNKNVFFSSKPMKDLPLKCNNQIKPVSQTKLNTSTATTDNLNKKPRIISNELITPTMVKQTPNSKICSSIHPVKAIFTSEKNNLKTSNVCSNNIGNNIPTTSSCNKSKVEEVAITDVQKTNTEKANIKNQALDPTRVILTVPQRSATPNMMVIGNDLIYNPYSTVQMEQSNKSSTNFNRNAYVAVNKAPNLTLFTTQFVAPCVNPVIIDRSITLPVIRRVSPNILMNLNTNTSLNVNGTETENNTIVKPDHENNLKTEGPKSNCINKIEDNIKGGKICHKTREENESPVIVQELQGRLVCNISTSKTESPNNKLIADTLANSHVENMPIDALSQPLQQNTSCDINHGEVESIKAFKLSKNFENNLASTTQENKSILSLETGPEIKNPIKKLADEDHKREKEEATHRERIQLKRMVILNRQLYHRCHDKPIALSYKSITPTKEVIQVNENLNNTQLKNDDNTNLKKEQIITLPKQNINQDEYKNSCQTVSINDNKGSQNTLVSPSRRILLRSSNVLKDSTISTEALTGDKKPRRKLKCPTLIKKRNTLTKPIINKNKTVTSSKSTNLASLENEIKSEEDVQEINMPTFESNIITNKCYIENQNKNTIDKSNYDYVDIEEKITSAIIPNILLNKCKMQNKHTENLKLTENRTEIIQNHSLIPNTIEKIPSSFGQNDTLNRPNTEDIEGNVSNLKEQAQKLVNPLENEEVINCNASNLNVSDGVCNINDLKIKPCSGNAGKQKAEIPLLVIEDNINNVKTHPVQRDNICSNDNQDVQKPISSENCTETQSETLSKESCTISHENVLNYKDKVIFEEMASNNNDPLKKCIRIKLPNGNTFKATISGKLNVNVDSIFEDPKIKALLWQNINNNTKCTLNIKQVSIKSPHISNTVNAKVNDISYMKKPIVSTETINLISDDEDTTQTFKTEFGNFDIASMNTEMFNKHQSRLSQKCVVEIERLPSAINIINESASELKSKDFEVTDNLTQKVTPTSTTCLKEKVSDFIEIDDSSNESGVNNIVPNTDVNVKKLNENVGYLKKMLRQDFEIEGKENILNNDCEKVLSMENSLNNISTAPDSEEIISKECLLRIEKCDDLIEKMKIQKNMCFVSLVRCDDTLKNLAKKLDLNSNKNLEENSEMSHYSSDENAIIVEEHSIQHSNLKRSGSLSILSDFLVSNESKIQKSQSVENNNVLLIPSSSEQPSSVSECNADWLMTKHDLQCYINKKSGTENENLKYDDETDCDSDIENSLSLNIPSVKETNTCCLNNIKYEVPTLVKLTVDYFVNNINVIENLKPYVCLLPFSEKPSNSSPLKRKSTGMADKVNRHKVSKIENISPNPILNETDETGLPKSVSNTQTILLCNNLKSTEALMQNKALIKVSAECNNYVKTKEPEPINHFEFENVIKMNDDNTTADNKLISENEESITNKKNVSAREGLNEDISIKKDEEFHNEQILDNENINGNEEYFSNVSSSSPSILNENNVNNFFHDQHNETETVTKKQSSILINAISDNENKNSEKINEYLNTDFLSCDDKIEVIIPLEEIDDENIQTLVSNTAGSGDSCLSTDKLVERTKTNLNELEEQGKQEVILNVNHNTQYQLGNNKEPKPNCIDTNDSECLPKNDVEDLCHIENLHKQSRQDYLQSRNKERKSENVDLENKNVNIEEAKSIMDLDHTSSNEVSSKNDSNPSELDTKSLNDNTLQKNVTLVYKGDSSVVLKGSIYEDPVVGTCYVFPILNKASYSDEMAYSNICDEKTINVIKALKNKVFEDQSESDEKENSNSFNVVIPKATYSRQKIKEVEATEKLNKKYLKRKSDTCDIKLNEKRYRKSKNIDYPKITVTAMTESAYSKEYKRLFNYCSSIKFSFSQPFHKEYIDVSSVLQCWPIKGTALNTFDKTDNENILFSDEKTENKEPYDPLRQTLAEEISSKYVEHQSPSEQISEINFSMGFGEGSGRVKKILEDGDNKSKFSAATLSDVKQSQPFLLSEDYEDYSKYADLCKPNIDQFETVKRYVSYLQLRDKVRAFFKKTTFELNYDWHYDKFKNKKVTYTKNVFPYDLISPDFIEPAPIETVVQVVQVGQLPVSGAAQNPVTCDPRVTQVTDASPSQCLVENSPHDDSQPTIKTEYTELTTADLSIPLAQEYERHIKSQESSKVPICNENIPVQMEISEVKVEEMPIKDEPVDYNDNDDLNLLVNKPINNVDFSYNSNESTSPLESRSNMLFETLQKQNSEFIAQQKQQNGSAEKSDQIAHAMNAAGITTTPEFTTNLVNIQDPVSPKMEATSPVPESPNYSNSSINAMSLQQAFGQILPPPLNQTNSQDNIQVAPNSAATSQVLHIVQSKNTNGNQITLVDNAQNSVINNSNTSVLHIVQNKGVNNNSTSNANNGQHSTSYGGLSLVDSGIQQGNNQLLHIVNTGNQKNPGTGQLLKRVNLLTNLTNMQGSNEQKMVQFLCKAADGKSIHLNNPHQRSMVLRLQPIESSNIQVNNKTEESSPSSNKNISTPNKETVNNQQEIKSRSVYEENYAKFIQNSSNKSIPEKSTSLPKFNQAFGKQVYQDNNQKSNDINSNNSHLSSVDINTEGSECQSSDNALNLDHIGQINSPPLLLRKSSSQTTSTQPTLMQQIKQTISPMNIQTMHGGVIYTRQIPVNIGGGQTINLITVPSTELADDTNQKQHNDVKFINQNEMESPIIKLVPQTSNTDVTSDESINNNSSNENSQNTPVQHQQPVLTQMRIKLPMLSKAPQMVSGTRLVRPSFFQIQRNVIGGANQPVYQQLVLTAAPPLGQHTIRLPQTQTTRPVKVTSESQSSSESQMSTSTLEQLREFDMVLEQVKERSTVQPNNQSNYTKLHTPSSDTAESTSITSTVTESTQQVLYSIGSNQSVNVAYVSRKPNVATPTQSAFERSPDSSGIIDSPSSSTSHVQIPHTVTSESTSSEGSSSQPIQQKAAKVSSKSKSRPKSSHPPNSLKINTVPPKTSTQKPLEDEQTTQRILYILAEYKEQVENSPDKDKPAPRRRNNPPSNPSGSSKRKKSSSSSRRPGARDISPVNGDDTCRTMGSEDSSCGTSQGDCTESCLESHSPQDSPRKVVRKLSFENETPRARPQPQRNVIVADGQTITVARGTAGKPTTAVLMPANYILPVSMVKGGQQIAIVTNRGPKLLTVGGGEGGTTNALLLQRLIGPAGLKPVLTRPGVRHVRLPTAALHNLQAFNLATAQTVPPPDSTASPAPEATPPELIETRTDSSPWADRESQDIKPERESSPEGSEPWNLSSSGDPHDYSYEETVRTDNMGRTVLDAIPDRYSPEMEAQRIFDKMFDVDSKKSYIVDSQDDTSRCAYDIDASDSDDKAYHQVVQRKDGGTNRQHRLTHVSAAALRHKYAILEHELRLQGTAFLQKSLSEECEDLGVDSPSAAELFPEAELFSGSPAHDAQQHSHTPQPTILNQSGIPQPDLEDQIASDRLLRQDGTNDQHDLGVTLGLDEGIVTVSEDGMQATITLDQEEFARSHPNTTFHSEPTDEGEVQPFTITGLKGRHITSTIFHAGRAPATVLVTAPQTTVISQATPDHVIHNNVKFANINQIINSSPTATHRNLNLGSVLVKDERLTKFDSILTDSRELHLSNTASAIVHSTGNATQVIRRVCYDDDKRDTRYLMDEPEPLIAGDDAKMIAEDSSRDATLESIAGDDDNSLPERHAELFWESNSASERSDGRRPLDFSSDSEKCCKSPSFDETNSTDSSGVGTHVRLDSVIKDTRGLERSTSGDGSSAEDIHPPLRTYPAKRMYHTIDGEMERSMSGKTRAGFPEERSESLEVRRRASGRGVVKRGCHCCNGSPAPPRPKKPRQRKPTMDFTSN